MRFRCSLSMDVRGCHLDSRGSRLGTDGYSCVGPGSFIEVTKMLPLLTANEPGHPSFHVVAPSLPGFAWSEGVSKPGFRVTKYAEVRSPSEQSGTFPLLTKIEAP